MKRTHTKLNTAEGQTKRFGVGMLSPTVVILLIMTAYPLIFTFFYSFTNYNLLRNLRSPAKITFFQNYVKLLKDPYFQQSIWNTVKFTIFAVIFEMLIGFAMALFVNSLHKGQKTMRTLLLLPYLLPTVTVALSWRMMLSPNYGIVNQVLQALHLPVFNWFSDIRTAFGMLVLIDVWQSAPFVFLLLYAALQSVPQGQYEAARIDGANHFQVFGKIVLPLYKAGLATIGLFNVVGRWNDWFTGMLYIKKASLIPLQTMLKNIQDNIDFLKQNAEVAGTPDGIAFLNSLPDQNLRMACTIIVIVPILCAYPFFQRYFVQGLTMGSVKE